LTNVSTTPSSSPPSADAHQRVNRRVVERVEHPAGRGEGGAETEGERDHDIVINPDQLGGARVERHGAHRHADLGPVHDQLEADHKEHGDDDHDQLVGGKHKAAEREVGGGQDRREGARRGAEEDLAGVLEQQRDADGGDQYIEGGCAPQRAVRKSLDQHAKHSAAGHGHEENDEAAPERSFRNDPPGEVADERADHEYIRVREIDEPQHPVNHRVAERDERVDRAER
jgi:hypothetical protein